LFAAVFILISLITFASAFRTNSSNVPFGYAFWFAVAACFLYFVNGFVMFAISLTVNRRRDERLQMAKMAPTA
jgi:uncharacterized protein (DUF58 family)